MSSTEVAGAAVHRDKAKPHVVAHYSDMHSNAVRAAPDVVARRLEDELVLVNMKTNRIFSLNRTGARFWELLAEGGGLALVEERMLQEFDVDPDQLADEMDDLVWHLSRAGLVEVDT